MQGCSYTTEDANLIFVFFMWTKILMAWGEVQDLQLQINYSVDKSDIPKTAQRVTVLFTCDCLN